MNNLRWVKRLLLAIELSLKAFNNLAFYLFRHLPVNGPSRWPIVRNSQPSCSQEKCPKLGRVYTALDILNAFREETCALKPMEVSGHRVGPIPLSIFLPLFAVVACLCVLGKVGPDIMTMLAVLAVGGYLCAFVGGTIPLLSKVGGPAIVAAFLPSYLVYRSWLPAQLITSIAQFTKTSQFIYLYVTAVVVGSILSLDRRALLRGAARVFLPLVAGSLLACATVPLLGLSMRVTARDSLFMIVAPITGGGVGEGAIPLSAGYGEILKSDAAVQLARILPVVLMANMFAIIGAGLLSQLGRWRPQWTNAANSLSGTAEDSGDARENAPANLLEGVMFGVLLYLAGIALQSATHIPAPVTMLLLTVLLRAFDLVPTRICQAAQAAGHLAAVSMTHPLLFAVAVALTPWSAVHEAFQPQKIALVFATVCILALSGFFLARFVRLSPVECALVNICHTGSGGTGDVAILSAANRMDLMPFAQIATRIGGAMTVSLALLLLRILLRGHA